MLQSLSQEQLLEHSKALLALSGAAAPAPDSSDASGARNLHIPGASAKPFAAPGGSMPAVFADSPVAHKPAVAAGPAVTSRSADGRAHVAVRAHDAHVAQRAAQEQALAQHQQQERVVREQARAAAMATTRRAAPPEPSETWRVSNALRAHRVAAVMQAACNGLRVAPFESNSVEEAARRENGALKMLSEATHAYFCQQIDAVRQTSAHRWSFGRPAASGERPAGASLTLGLARDRGLIKPGETVRETVLRPKDARMREAAIKEIDDLKRLRRKAELEFIEIEYAREEVAKRRRVAEPGEFEHAKEDLRDEEYRAIVLLKEELLAPRIKELRQRVQSSSGMGVEAIANMPSLYTDVPLPDERPAAEPSPAVSDIDQTAVSSNMLSLGDLRHMWQHDTRHGHQRSVMLLSAMMEEGRMGRGYASDAYDRKQVLTRR